MEERIIIERDIEYLKELEREREEMFMTFPEYKTEQVPETFEELKVLVKNLKTNFKINIADCFIEIKFGEVSKDNISFCDNGNVYIFNDEILMFKDRTIPQMWDTIKSLVEE